MASKLLYSIKQKRANIAKFNFNINYIVSFQSIHNFATKNASDVK